MKIAVGSKNPVKIDAVRESVIAFDAFAEVVGVGVSSGVSDQPLTLDEIQTGAINRAKKALATGADWGVGIEAGITKVSNTLTDYVDVAWCAIVDNNGNMTVGGSPQFEWPHHFVAHAKSGKEIGRVCATLTGDPNTKQKQGGIGVLSKGLLPRKDFCKMAVICALIPRLNPKMYDLKV